MKTNKHCCLVCCRPTENKYKHFLTHLGEAMNELEDFEWFLHKVASGQFTDQQIVARAKQMVSHRSKNGK